MTKHLSTFAVVLLATTALEGCRSVRLNASGDMVAVYQFGEFRMLLNSNAPSSARAVQKALLTFDLYQTSAVTHTYDAEFTARARNDQKITVNASEVNRNQTLLRIRWGEGGDLAKSRRLYEAIEANLAR